MLVKEELSKMGLHFILVDLGVIEIIEELNQIQLDTLKENLMKSGLELMEDKKGILVEKIKILISEMIQHLDDQPKLNYSEYLAEELQYDYTYLSNIFTEVKGITIQQYIIINKVERIKELLLYGELNLNQISYKLNYSSAAHLSTQFKKITGLTPTFYKQLKQQRIVNLENL